jgi:hypothetical protein
MPRDLDSPPRIPFGQQCFQKSSSRKLIAPSQDCYVAKSHNNVVSGSMNSNAPVGTMNSDRQFVVSMNWGEPLANSVVEQSDV